MNPYLHVADAVKNGESLLSLCCGIGLELADVMTEEVTAVDVALQYLLQVPQRCPQAKIVCDDALSFLKLCEDKSYDVISIIDGIEHMDKQTGLLVIKHMKRVAKERVLLFTPQGEAEDGYLRNEPHNAWDIIGADEYQKHRSGWTQAELEKLGFRLVESANLMSQHDEPYKALMMSWEAK